MPNALECEFAYRIPGTQELEESLALVPLRYGSRVTGVIVISKLGLNQFDEDDVRLLEVLAGQASVALENARLYEQQRREAEGAKALLAFADVVTRAHTVEEICGHTVETAVSLFETEGASLWLGDVCAASIGPPLSEGVSSPLAEGDGIQGRLVLGATALDEDRERLFASFSYQASVALQKARLYWKQLEAAEIANALLEASRELATAESPDDVLGRSVEVTARVLGTERAALWIQEETAGDLVARASYGYAPDADPVVNRRFPGPLAHQCFSGRTEPFVLEPEDVARVEGVLDVRIARFVVAPLRLEGGRVAALTATIGDRQFDDRQLRLLAGLAHQAKLAIESAEHYESLEHTFVSTVASLANALEANDAYTSSHARWITDMALLVGRELHLDRDALKRLELGALFHDIGKIGIPSEILRKPGPLTDEEFEIVKGHPELGERILAPIDRLADVRPIVRACHERWDGLGYPDGTLGRCDPCGGPDRARLRRLPRDGHGPSVSRAPARRRGGAQAARGGRHPVRPRGGGHVRPPLPGWRGAAALAFGVRRVLGSEHVTCPVALLPLRHRRLAVRLRDEARVLDERVVVDVARAVRKHFGRAHAPEKLCLGEPVEQWIVVDVLCDPVQAKTFTLLEVDEEQPDVWVDERIPRGEEHPVAVVVRERNRVLVDDANEAGVAALVRALRPSLGVGRRDEDHVAALDEGPVVVVDPVSHEPLVDPVGEPARVEAILVAATAVVEEGHRASSTRRMSQTSWKPRRLRIGYDVSGTACVISAGVPRPMA